MEEKLDLALIRRAAEGSERSREAWAKLYLDFRPRLGAFIRGMLKNPTLVEDMLQETFWSAYQGIGALKDPTVFKSWLFGIGHHKCMNEIRRKGFGLSGDVFEEDRFNSEIPEPWQLAVKEEEGQSFAKMLEDLPADQKSAVFLYFAGDFSQEEIAAIQQVPLGTVKSRLSRALGKLKDKIIRQA